MSLNIYTLNIRGFRDDPKKRLLLKELLDIHKVDILLLQETHIENISQSKHHFRGLDYETYNSFGDYHSRGVTILVKSTLEYKLIKFHHDYEGRLCYIDISFHDFPMRIINVYCPNNGRERRDFIKSLDFILATSKSILLGGDYNFVENTHIDKNIHDDSLGTAGRKEIINLKNDFDLCDPFRSKHPEKRIFTWSGRGVYSRLDRFYMSKTLLPFYKKPSLVTFSLSDHTMVGFKLQDFSGVPHVGASYWKANVSVFEDIDFVKDLGILWSDFKHYNFQDALWWEAFKENVRDLVIFHSKKKSHSFYNRLKEKEGELREKMSLNSSSNIHGDAIDTLKSEIENLVLERAEGSKIRNNIDILNNKERPSRYFFRRERKRQSRKFINKLVDTDTEYTSHEDILGYIKSFYRDLYTDRQVDDSLIDHFTADIKTLSVDDAELCEGDFTLEECRQAITDMETGKSPGPDGLPSEFYKKFFDIFGKAFLIMINSSFKENTLPESFSLGYITLLCKNPAEAENIKNWRPISLLNTDYKLVSKVLTSRLRKVIGTVVDIDQTCAVPNRSILDNCHLFRNIVDYIKQKNLRTILVSLDLEKAFDKVSHRYLYSVLHSFGFGEQFIKWIRLLYEDASISVLVNGHLTDPFPYLRGVRQGCPLSPLLYVLAVEPLAEKIRREKDIRGLALPVTGETVKVSQFADDLSVIVTEGSSVDRLLVVLDTFSRASGSNVNRNKSKALNLGYWRGRPPDHICGIPIVESLKVVGIYIHPVKGIFYEWEKILSSAEKTLNMWRSRSLSFFEKTILINSIVCSKLYYVSFSTLVPQRVIDKLNKLIFSFLWGNRHESINRKTMVLPKQFGGCGAVDLKRKMAALHLTHIQRLLKTEHARWKALAVYWAGFGLRGLEPIFGSNLIPHSESRPEFYSILLDRFNAVRSSLPDMAWGNATAKSLYNILGSLEPVVLKTVERNPTIDFRITWGALNSGLLAPYAHETCFLIAHGTLPTNDLLHKYNISKRTSCFFCNQSESIAHLFLDCAVVQSTIDRSVDTYIRSRFRLEKHVILCESSDRQEETRGVAN